jgi:hypothetical protein
MTNTGGPRAGESAAGRSATPRALLAYADAKRRLIGRRQIVSDRVTQNKAVRSHRAGSSLKAPER